MALKYLWNQYAYLEQQFLKKPGIVLAVNRGFTMCVVCKSENLKPALLKTDFWHAGKKYQWTRHCACWNHPLNKKTQIRFKNVESSSYHERLLSLTQFIMHFRAAAAKAAKLPFKYQQQNLWKFMKRCLNFTMICMVMKNAILGGFKIFITLNIFSIAKIFSTLKKA